MLDYRRAQTPRKRTRALKIDQRRMTTLLVVMVPVIVVLFMGWQHRWISDDGFINFRYVDQIRHGNGPVFNAGERVEAFTSPAWLALLLGLDLILPLRIEWIAVLSGLALTATGFAFAAAGSVRLWRNVVGEGAAIPAGLLVFAALPPAWDFATSGLDGSLGVAWLGASWWALCRRVVPDKAPSQARTKTAWWSCVLIGLGPLVRPDLAIMTVVFLAVLLVSETSWRARGRVFVWALAVPVAYEVFRMGYYGLLLPNTALAKEAGASEWGRGWKYFLDFVQPYYLWIPLALLVLVGVIPLIQWTRGRASRLQGVLIGAPLVAAFVHAGYVVRVGGDFMHARMLLPSLFCLLLPVGVVVISGWRWVPASLLLPWLLVTAVALRQAGSDTAIANERDFYVRHSGHSNPVTIDDYYSSRRLDWARVGRDTRVAAERGERGLLLNPFDPRIQPLPLKDEVVDTPVVSVVITVGLYGYAAGRNVFVVDSLGLSNAIGSHFRPVQVPELDLPHARAGHEKQHRGLWEIARYASRTADKSPRVRDARRSLRCGTYPDLLQAVDRHFGAHRAWQNFWDSITLTRFRAPESPVKAVRELCG